MNIFSTETYVEEDFQKNRIKCALAAGNTDATLGFVVTGKAKPMTLLKGNELDVSKSKKLNLVLRRKKGDTTFSEILVGDEEILALNNKALASLISAEITSTEYTG